VATFQEIIKGEKPVLVDFHADWCGPCKIMNPVLKNIKGKLGKDLIILKINIDNNPAAAEKFQVRGVPTFILFKNGEIKWRQSGIIEEENFIQLIQKEL
jgi:thioredoxin 1